jgi:hypothetical protein
VTASVNLPGKSLIKGAHFGSRSARLTGGPHETFGDGAVTVHYSGATNYTHLVATVSIQGGSTIVTEGAAPIKSSSGVVKIPLMNEAVLLPRGIPIYASAPPPGAAINIGSATLKLSFLKRAVSK